MKAHSFIGVPYCSTGHDLSLTRANPLINYMQTLNVFIDFVVKLMYSVATITYTITTKEVT